MDKKELSRRDFFRELGMIAGVSAAAVSFPWLKGFSQESVAQTAGHKARIGIIGCGSRGNYLLEFLVRNPDVEITYLCDDYQPNLDIAIGIAPLARHTSDYRQVLESADVDGVVIATPLHLHHHIAIDAFSAGKHVFCEKSIAITPDQTLDIFNTHQRSGKVLFVGQQRLYDPYYLAAMEMVNQGLFGTIENIKTFWYRNNNWRRPVPSPELERKINWRLYREYSCGLMTELACHQLQVGTWIWRDIPKTIYASGAITFWKDGREVEDTVSATYTFKDGRRMSFEALGCNSHYGLEEQIMGSLGTIEPEVGKYYYSKTAPMPGFLQILNNIERNVFDTVAFAGPSWDPEIARKNQGEYILGRKRTGGDGTEQLMAAFAQGVITGEQPPMIAQEGYYATILSLLGQQSMDEKRIIEFPEQYRLPNYI